MGYLSTIYHKPVAKDRIKIDDKNINTLSYFNRVIEFVMRTYVILQKYSPADLKSCGITAPQECFFEGVSRGIYELDTPTSIFQLGICNFGTGFRIVINQRNKENNVNGNVSEKKLVFEFLGEKYLVGKDSYEFHFSFGNEDITLPKTQLANYLEVYSPHPNDKVVFKGNCSGNGQYIIVKKDEAEQPLLVSEKNSVCEEFVNRDGSIYCSPVVTCTTYSCFNDALGDALEKISVFKKNWFNALRELEKTQPASLKVKSKIT